MLTDGSVLYLSSLERVKELKIKPVFVSLNCQLIFFSLFYT